MQQLSYISNSDVDIIGLQEFWCASPEYTELWENYAKTNGYVMHCLPRVNGKQDGCALLVKAERITAEPEFSCYHYEDWGSRVLQVAKLAIDGEPLVLMQTHLTFPHPTEHDPAMRRYQARKLSELVREQTLPTVVFGDLNNPSKDDEAIRILTDEGGVRPLPPPPPSEEDGQQWYSHVAHTGALMPCDHVLTRGDVEVKEWSLGGSVDELVSRKLPSDHRPLHATLVLTRAS